MNKKMLIAIIIAAIVIIGIIIAILVLSSGQSDTEDNSSLNMSSSGENTTVTNETANTVEDPLAAISQQEVELYNTNFTAYIGTGKKGIDVRSLMDMIISSNNTNAGIAGKFVSVDASTIDTASGVIGTAGTSENTTEYVTDCNSKITALKEKIDISKSYDIEATYSESGLITGIIIKETAATGNSSLTPTASDTMKETVLENVQIAVTAAISSYFNTSAGGTARDLATYIKTDLESATGTVKSSLPANYAISEPILAANSVTFKVTVDGVVYSANFNAIEQKVTIE